MTTLTRATLPAEDARLLAHPERAAQFGTGALLRGLIDFFVDAANRHGQFDGRIVAIGSTGSGRDAAIGAQDGLFTLVTQGLVAGEPYESHAIVTSVSRALSAATEWDAVLAVARQPELELVFSNTTEVGIVMNETDRHDDAPPSSFPAKLARFLAERAAAFDYDEEKGVVVLPSELIEDNGAKLRAMVLAHAARWGLDARFAEWIERAVPFCNTLVDRIVPGAPKGPDVDRIAALLGYDDALVTTCEPYRLFAIEAPRTMRPRQAGLLEHLSEADEGIVVTDDVTPYRERKVRLLNGTHTAMVPAALLLGCSTVREAMVDARVGAYVRRIMLSEIVPTLEGIPGAADFAHAVLDRFANPFIRHALVDITLQATMKTRVRLVPTIRRYAARFGEAPPALAFALASHLLLLRDDTVETRADDQAPRIRAAWAALGGSTEDSALSRLVRDVLADSTLWETDLTAVPGFEDAVRAALLDMTRRGVPAALDALLAAPPRLTPA